MRRSLGAAVAVGASTLPLQARLVTPPRYTLACPCEDKVDGLALLSRAIAAAEEEIGRHPGGTLTVVEAPLIVDESNADEAVARLIAAL